MPILRSELYAQQADRPWRYGVLELWQQEEKEERDKTMIEYEELRTDTGCYLMKRFKYYKSLVFPTKDNIF